MNIECEWNEAYKLCEGGVLSVSCDLRHGETVGKKGEYGWA